MVTHGPHRIVASHYYILRPTVDGITDQKEGVLFYFVYLKSLRYFNYLALRGQGNMTCFILHLRANQ